LFAPDSYNFCNFVHKGADQAIAINTVEVHANIMCVCTYARKSKAFLPPEANLLIIIIIIIIIIILYLMRVT